jgi:hypothetical protein
MYPLLAAAGLDFNEYVARRCSVLQDLLYLEASFNLRESERRSIAFIKRSDELRSTC